MPRLILPALLACLMLVACGADGEPQAPGVTFSGSAKVGVGTALK